MDQLYALQAFIKIVEKGSLTAAAAALDVSQPAMARTLAALERELGVRLLNRTTRRMSLTDEGRDFHERGRQIIAALEDARQSLSARRATPRGRLRIASSVPFGRMFVAPVVAEYLAAHPQVHIELLLLDRIVDLVEEGIDVAVRVARLPDSSMVAHSLGSTRRMVVASPKLIGKSGAPKHPDDLRDRRCVSFTGAVSAAHWIFREKRRRLQVPVNSVLVTNQIDAAILACAAGAGYGQFFCYHVLDQIKAGCLKAVLGRYEDEPTPISILYPSARHPSPNILSFVDFARDRIKSRLHQLQQHAKGAPPADL